VGERRGEGEVDNRGGGRCSMRGGGDLFSICNREEGEVYLFIKKKKIRRKINHRKGVSHISYSKALMSENSKNKKTNYRYNVDVTFVTSYPSIGSGSATSYYNPGTRIARYEVSISARFS
jgi:hypothetical protein